MLHTDLSISSTPKARAQRLRSPGCPQLHTTNDSPLQGPCHLSDPHITLLLILNLPLIQMGSQSICGLVSNHSSSNCPSKHSSHAGLPAVLSMHAKCLPTLQFLHCWFPLPEMLFPSYLACWLSHIKMSAY